MSTNDPLAACLSKINNAEKVSKREITVEGVSKMKKAVLEIFKKHGYVADIGYTENRRGGAMTVQLSGTVNKCGVVKPRFKCSVGEIEKFEQRYLPAKGFGILVLSTPKGLLTNAEAKTQHIGGRVVAYCY